MSLISRTVINKSRGESKQSIVIQPEKPASKFNQGIEIRELDKRYTYANPKRGKCTMDGCNRQATHWLTRHNAEYCQSDMICHQHAILWKDIKELISTSKFTN